MKKTLLTLAMVAVSVAAFAQGKINFNNDSLHLVYFTSDTTKLVAGDTALGLPLSTTVLTAGGTLQADLWAGSSSDALSLYKTTTFSATPGKWTATTTLLSSPLLLGATMAYFEVVVHDTRITGASVAAIKTAAQDPNRMNQYYGWSPVFTAVPSSSSYVNLYASTSPTLSTWPAGTQAVSGGFGSIELVANVPEPTTMALAGLGIAGLLIFRRRK